MNDQTKSRLRYPVRPLVRGLLALHVPPNAVTVTGLVLSIGAGCLLSQGRFTWALIVLLLAGLSDVVDGDLARWSDRPTSTGAFLDSSLDRFSEFAVFFGLSWHYRLSPNMAALVFATLFASFAVSYVRARAEGIGIECRVGVFERPVRFLILVLGILFRRYLPVALGIILLGSVVTVIERLVHVLRRAR